MCAFCGDYPCEIFGRYFVGYPILKQDNELLRTQGIDAWLKLQSERQSNGFTYTEEK